MKLLRVLLALAVACLPSVALGATRGGAPQKFSIPFGNSAGSQYITYPTPTGSQIGIKCGAASLTDGFPPLTMQPVSAGGCPPLGQDFNGILKQITQWNQQTSMGAAPAYDGAFSASIGGYPAGAILSQASNAFCVWISQVDNNITNPDAAGAGWTSACPGGGVGIGTSTGSANAQVITTTPFVLQAGATVCWTPGGGLTNTAGTFQINVNGSGLKNVFVLTIGGYATPGGGEARAGAPACVIYDGTQYEILNSGANASLTLQNQTLSGGANVVSQNLGTGSGGGTVTVNCGLGPLQFITNNGSFTFAAPANDGSCLILVTNGGAAGTISFSGFKVNSNTGDAFTTTSTNQFMISIARINGTATYLNKALQ